jgi:hypothetical protein
MNCNAKVHSNQDWKGTLVPRKVVKVYLTPQQKNLVERICHSLGMDESELLRYAFMEFARSVGLVTEKILGKI